MKKSILFLCTGNSCRSQMAEGWARQLHSDWLEAYSAGIEKHGLNPYALQVMAEAGVDISAQQSKLLSELPRCDFDLVITVCADADENCPFFAGTKKIIHHSFDDPPKLAQHITDTEQALDCYRRVRDEIHAFVSTISPDVIR